MILLREYGGGGLINTTGQQLEVKVLNVTLLHCPELFKSQN